MILASKEDIATHTATGWWTRETNDARFRANAAATPDRVAVVDPPNRDEIDGGKPLRLTYRQLADLADRIATSFQEAGLKKDDVLVVQLPNTSDLVAVYLAAWRVGLIVSPAPVQWRAHELCDVLDFVGAKAAVTTRRIRGYDHGAMFTGLKASCSTLSHLIVVDETEWPEADTTRLDS